MPEDWTREEVEATVADYFDMLDTERRGLDYNKTAHRHRLAALLRNRSDGSIERKHQNISAILIQFRIPPIIGYKPLRNYQRLLFDVVSDRLQNNQRLIDIVRNHVDQPAIIPTVEDILSAMVEPPRLERSHRPNIYVDVREPSAQYNVDYIEREARNRSLGTAGEQFVVQFEKARLKLAGQERLASKVKHVSLTQGDGAGYDVLSFETTGRERLIEVKTTAYGPSTPFFVTRNEVVTSQKAASDYYLYRAYDFRRNPRLFNKRGPLDQSFQLDPTQYMASISLV